MADDTTVDNGALADYSVAADDDGSGNLVQVVKLALSADGSRTPITADAGGLLVNLGTNNDVTVTSGSITADTELPAAVTLADNMTPADTPIVGSALLVFDGTNYDRVRATTGDGGGGTGFLANLPYMYNGSNYDRNRGDAANGLDVDVTRLPALVAGSASIGVLGANSGVDIGDVTINNAAGASAVNIQDGGNTITVDGTITANLAAGTNNIGDVDVLTLPAIPAGTNNIGDVDVLTMPGTYAEDVGHNSGETGVFVLGVRNTAMSTLTTTDGDYSPIAVDSAGRANVSGQIAHDVGVNGNPVTIAGVASAAAPSDVSNDQDAVRLWALRNGALATNITAAGALIPGDAANGLDVDVTRLPTLANVTTVGTVTTVTGVTTVSTLTGGGIAHDSPDSGNPVKVGARARTTDVTAVAADDRTDLLSSLTGKLATLPYALPGQQISGTLNRTDNTGADVIASQGGSIRTYITHALVTNAHATVSTKVSIRDGTTVKYVGYAAAVGGGFSITFPVPLRGTAATAWTAICGTTGADVDISLSGYTAAE